MMCTYDLYWWPGSGLDDGGHTRGRPTCCRYRWFVVFTWLTCVTSHASGLSNVVKTIGLCTLFSQQVVRSSPIWIETPVLTHDTRPSTGFSLGQRLRRWSSAEPALMFAGNPNLEPRHLLGMAAGQLLHRFRRDATTTQQDYLCNSHHQHLSCNCSATCQTDEEEAENPVCCQAVLEPGLQEQGGVVLIVQNSTWETYNKGLSRDLRDWVASRVNGYCNKHAAECVPQGVDNTNSVKRVDGEDVLVYLAQTNASEGGPVLELHLLVLLGVDDTSVQSEHSVLDGAVLYQALNNSLLKVESIAGFTVVIMGREDVSLQEDDGLPISLGGLVGIAIVGALFIMICIISAIKAVRDRRAIKDRIRIKKEEKCKIVDQDGALTNGDILHNGTTATTSTGNGNVAHKEVEDPDVAFTLRPKIATNGILKIPVITRPTDEKIAAHVIEATVHNDPKHMSNGRAVTAIPEEDEGEEDIMVHKSDTVAVEVNVIPPQNTSFDETYPHSPQSNNVSFEKGPPAYEEVCTVHDIGIPGALPAQETHTGAVPSPGDTDKQPSGEGGDDGDSSLHRHSSIEVTPGDVEASHSLGEQMPELPEVGSNEIHGKLPSGGATAGGIQDTSLRVDNETAEDLTKSASSEVINFSRSLTPGLDNPAFDDTPTTPPYDTLPDGHV